MEDALNDEVNTTVMPISLKSVEVDISEEPTIDSDKEDSKTVKVNGDTKVDNSDGTESSDYDNLVIDERPRNNRKRKQLSFSPESGFKGFKRIKNEEEYEPPMNPYFNESLFELSELHNNKNVHSLEKSANSEEKSNTSSTTTTTNQVDDIGTNSSTTPTPVQLKKLFGKKKKAGSPKLREYAQYLGLQPTVQFKCSRCALRGFSSLALLNEHQLECTGEGPTSPPVSTQTTAPSTNFRVTRKVYLCSACGTYYENWNLFLHMREIHKRFVCLYCLGMFSQPEKLSLHLVTKHNCVPSQLNSEEDFFHVYKEPCFLMCCECEKVFSERDNFFGHTCCGKTSKIGAEFKSKNNAGNTNGNNHRQLINQKNNKNSKQAKNNKTFVEHVTGDTTVESKEEKMSEEIREINCKEPEDTQEDEMRADEKEEIDEYNDKNEENFQDQVSQDADVIDTIDDNQEVGVELSKDESPDKSDVDLKARESESEVEDIAESPRYESESPANQEESDFKEVNEETIDEYDAIKSESDQGDTRKVPKVTLRLPKNTTPYVDHEDSDDSDKLMMEFDSVDADVKIGVNVNDEKENKDPLINMEPTLDVAGSEIPIIELELEHPLDKFDIQLLLQKCLKETIPTCVYCNHARKIAVNGKQLGLHAIAEHRFSAIVNSITAEELIPESFVMRIKESLSELQNVYFNLESSVLDEGMTFSHVFECFQCRYATTIHKELYLHNRKMHAKTILLCIMCKSNFYSYSELICHLCPGLYELNNDVNFRCCMCVCDDLPSAFRLMVHLRKRHHACDVCLELCHNQSRLSNHVWKHKLHHLCYRCGIAYRNKPDITKHLFWKHGTESVLCKKCLQKKWPHVYHFCIPPSTFTCEECNLNFTKAVALKVHKRIHRDEKPHACTFENCNEKFISKKLLLKHEFKHREPPEDTREKDNQNKVQEIQDVCTENGDEKPDEPDNDENSNETTEKKPKPRVDVYDLPELNLSESDSSDSEEEAPKIEKEDLTEDVPKLETSEEASKTVESGSEQRISDDPAVVSTEPSAPVLENIWDDFKLYQASKEKMENIGKSETDTEGELPNTLTVLDEKPEIKQEEIVDIIMRDHDYSLLSQEYKTEPQKQQPVERTSMDHDYCSSGNKTELKEENSINDVSGLQSLSSPEKKEVKVSSTSDSSNDSDSSSCTCGSNCSCSGSSDSSSSSSDSSDSDSSSSEGRRKQQARRERRKRAKGKKETETSPIDVVATDNQAAAPVEQHIEETDLDTTETETDEDFYDKQPQKLASKLIAEKRKELMLLAGIGTLANGAVLESSRPSTPSLPETETLKVKKKSKNKKKKKKRKQEKHLSTIDIPSTSYQYQHQLPIVSPLTISLTKNSPLASPNHTPQIGSSTSLEDQMLGSNSDVMNMSDSSLRASKRRRIPNKFYGYSSDEDADKPHHPVLKWRKADLPSPARPTPNSPLVVPPITIKALPPPPPPTFEEAVPNRTANLNEMRVQQQQIGFVPPNFQINNPQAQEESGSESNESSSEEEQPQPPPLLNKPPNQPPLYCYCRCPYDEVSEMIGCDADDCLIEWFHFECVGIMVPPKGQWFCPDCRKKKQQRKELTLT